MIFCVRQVVNGMGGIGKSAVSEKYATEWQKMYGDGVFHFNAESLASLHISIRGNVRVQEAVRVLLFLSVDWYVFSYVICP